MCEDVIISHVHYAVGEILVNYTCEFSLGKADS